MEFPAFEWIRRTAYFLHSGDYYMEKHSPASKLSRALSGVAGKGRTACNYFSGTRIPPSMPLWLPVD